MAKISYVGRSIMPQEFLRIREELGLPTVSFAAASRALRDDLFDVVVLLDGEAPAGCCRVIGDGALTFYIQDLLVVPKLQRKGVGTKVMELVLGHLATIAPPEAFVGLMAAPGTEGFFARNGFAARPADAPGMQLVSSRKASQA